MFEIIEGWPLSNLIPGHFGQNKWGRGKASIASYPIVVGLTGTITSSGSMTAGGAGEQSFSYDQSLALTGARSTAMQQASAAFEYPGVSVVHLPPEEAVGAVGATIAITFGGTWTTSGSVYFWVNGNRIEVNVGSSDDVADACANAVIAFGANQTLPVTAAAVSPVVTLIVASKGTQGNTYLLGLDMSAAPAGMTVALAGGTPLHDKLVPFSGGTGTEDLTDTLAAAETVVIDYWAIAQTDATNAGRVKTFVETQAGPMIQHMESAHFGHNGTFAAATTFASSTLNHVQCALTWMRNSESHPSVLAASSAALRSTVVGANPNYVYSGKPLKGVAPQRYAEDRPGMTEQDAALHNGVTVVMQQGRGDPVTIVRECVSKCLTGSTQNLNTYGWPHVDVPFYERKQFAAEYLARREVNPNAGPDPAEGEASARPGKETPSSLKSAFMAIKKSNEERFLVRDVDANPVSVDWDYDRNCLIYFNPCLVGHQNLKCGGTTSQTV